jgi:hypothetical protein
LGFTANVPAGVLRGVPTQFFWKETMMIRKFAMLGLMVLALPLALALTACQTAPSYGVMGNAGRMPVTNDKGRILYYSDAPMNMR